MSKGQAALGSGAYLPWRKLCCSEGLVSLSKRTEAPTRQTFLLPDPQQPLPGGGGRGEEDRLRVTTYQARPGLVCTTSPKRARTPSPLCHQAAQGRAPCFHVPGLSTLIYHPGETDSSSAKLHVFSALHCTEEPFISLDVNDTTHGSRFCGWAENIAGTCGALHSEGVFLVFFFFNNGLLFQIIFRSVCLP